MKRCIVHIGSGKCGSTALQKTLSARRSWLEHRGFALFVPNDMQPIVAMNMATYLEHARASEEHVIRSRGVSSVTDAQARIAAFKRRLANVECEQMLVSNEYFADVHPGRHAARLRILERIQPAADELTLVYYVRKPDDLFVSLYLQWFMPDMPISMAEFYRDFDFGGARSNALSLNWYRHAQTIKEIFPTARLLIRPYERAAAAGIVRDFTDSIGLASLPPLPSTKERKNVSLRGLGYRIYASSGSRLPTRVRRLFYRALLKANPATRYDDELLLPNSKRREMLGHYKHDLAKLRSEFGVDRETLERWYTGFPV